MPRQAREAVAPTTTIDRERGELLLLSDLVLAEFIRHLARYGGTLLEEDGLVLFRGPHPHANPFRNGAICLTTELPAPEVIKRGREFFGARQSSFVLWSREHADGDLIAEAEREGIHELERIPGIVLEQPPEARTLPDGIELRRASDEATRLDYLRVTASAWGLEGTPLPLAAQLLFHPDSADGPHVVSYVAYENGEALSGGMAMAACGVVWGCQGATLPAARGRGLAQSTFRAALVECLALSGATLTLGNSSGAGLPVWLDFGFVPFTGYRRHLVPPPRAGVDGA